MTCKYLKKSFFAANLLLFFLMVGGCSGLMNKHPNFEHVALNVKDPVVIADWYCENLGMKVMYEGNPPGNARFVSDAGGNMMFELYHNSEKTIPDYPNQDMVVLHIAFEVDNVKETCDRLVKKAGATWDKELTVTDSGDEIATLRDPWGLAIQFVKRAKPMI